MVLNLPGRCSGRTGVDDAVASAEPGVARHCLRCDRHPLRREGCTAWQSECGCCQGPWGKMDEGKWMKMGVSFGCKLDGQKRYVLVLNELMPKIYFHPQGWRVGSVSCCHHCAFGSPTATMGRGCSRQHLRIGCGHRTRSSSRGVRKSVFYGFLRQEGVDT